MDPISLLLIVLLICALGGYGFGLPYGIVGILLLILLVLVIVRMLPRGNV